MNKRELRKVILGQLAVELRMSVVIDGDLSDEDMARADEVQHELAAEFERRAEGGKYSAAWEVGTRGAEKGQNNE
jgi:hypothetical protein